MLFENKKFFSLKLKTIIGAFLIISLFLSGGFVYTIASFDNKDDVDKVYTDKKNEIQTKIDTISKTLDGISSKYNDSKKQSTNLSTQESDIITEINKTNSLITDTRIIIGQLDKQIQENQKQKTILSNTVKDILKQIQIKNRVSPIEIILSNTNLGSLLSETYNLSTLQQRLNDKKTELEKVDERLLENRKQNEQIQDQLEKTRNLLKSRQSSLDALLQQTNNEQSKYKDLLDSISQQKKELEGQLQGIQGEYLSEIEDLKNSGSQQNYTINCKFEAATPLDVPSGFFTRPTIGYLTQDFNCGHDGVDIANSLGTDIYSVADGTISRVAPSLDGCVGLGCNGGFGNYIVIKHVLPSGQRVYSLYAHMQHQSTKQLGEAVKRGEIIGKIGCTGYTLPYPCGVHTHFMLLSDTFEKTGAGCRLGLSTCYNPLKFINPIS